MKEIRLPSIIKKYQKCGKPNCHCQNNETAHGPYYWYVKYVKSKSSLKKGKYKWQFISKDPKEVDKFLQEHNADILGMSALLTTTMPYMKVVIDELKNRGIRKKYIVLVGGAPVNEAFAEEIEADAYCRDAAVAVDTAKKFLAIRNQKQGS